MGLVIFIVVSTGHFDPLIAECNRLANKYDFLGQIGSSTVTPVFPHFRTAEPTKIEAHMQEAELIISHGGAGMTAMINLFRKPSVIIPKQRRYGEANDLQVELAKKWGALGMGILCMNVEDLEASIEKARETKFNFPQFPALGDHLRKLMGFESPAMAKRAAR
jgi:UDP-N-acetylglucosamine transferase subunit ALG13